jgi:hypothetical protein
LPPTTPNTGAALAQQHQCTSQKIFEGMEPRKSCCL